MSWTSYESHPWAGIDTNKREWYVPALYDFFTKQSVFSQFVTTQFGLDDPRTTKLHISSLIPPHSNFDALGVRDMWLSAKYMDSRERQVTVNH